jgi:hypothetical protein
VGHFDKGRKYKFFPRSAEAETFYLTGEGRIKNFMADGRIRKIVRHKNYDEMWVQCGYYQRKKWLIVIFKNLRVIMGTLKPNDLIHMFGTTDKWGKKRVYIVMGIIKYPSPAVHEVDDYSLDMELYKAQVKSQEEAELEEYMDLRVKEVGKYALLGDDDDSDATNNEVFLPDNDEE